VVVPDTLILRVCIQRVLQHLELRLDLLEWQGIQQAWQILVEKWHQLASVVPRREVCEVLPDDRFCHIAFFLDECLLGLVARLIIDFDHPESLCNLFNVQLSDPQAVVPAVEVAFVHLEHLVAKHQLHFEYFTLLNLSLWILNLL
jgi:hypothetical protein